MKAKRIAIIGAGASGLTATKCCLDEGLEPVCFEKTSDIGGLWNFRPDPEEDVGCVMQSTIINTSKEITSFSDFLISADSPNFMHHSNLQKYFNEYADHFGIRKYIRFNTQVLQISKAENFENTGQWTVRSKDKTGEKIEVYDAVLLCTGHHTKPHMAKFEGVEDFLGKRLHTFYYREYPTEYIGQRIVVIGIGNSSLDAAVELSRVASQVFVSTRRGTWVLNRVSDNGLPLDIAFNRRTFAAAHRWFPRLMVYLAELKLNARFDHKLYGIRPQHRVNQQHPAVNDDLPNRILSGTIRIKPDVKRITRNGVEFEDGTVEDDIDTIFYATGYEFGFPFLDKSVINVEENRVDLYKLVFPPDLEHPTLAVIGCIQPIGSVMPISEMQARWAARVFKGDVRLPSSEDMWKDIHLKWELMAKQYFKSQKHTIQVDFIPYLDELAEKIGCAPQIGKLLLTDPRLAYKLLCGPCIPCHYRLHGHGAWEGAKNAIETMWERVEKPLKTRECPPMEKKDGNPMMKAFLLLILPVLLVVLLNYMF